MLFEDTAALNTIIGYVRSDVRHNQRANSSNATFHDEDPEVDRLFNFSPPVGAATTFEDSALYMEDKTHNRKTSETHPTDVEASPTDDSKQEVEVKEVKTKAEEDAEMFQRVEVQTSTNISSLSRMISKGSNNSEANDSSANTQLTLFLPDHSCVALRVHDSNTVDEVIKRTLAVHKKLGMLPSLHYTHPERYELRLHEGGGWPDEDFPALDRERQLKKFGDVSEYCLCQIEGSNLSFDVGAGAALESPINRFLINVKMPKNMYVKKRLMDTTTARDLLAMIARTHRLRLYTEEYVFVLSQEDQSRLQLTSAILDENIPILPLAVQELCLQRKIYADAPKMHTAKLNPQTDDNSELRPDPESMMFMFNDVTAAVYQEWNIVKKNKFGRRQERVIGVDAHKIYNAKKEGRAGMGVYRAHRNISAIRDISYLAEDSRAFRVVFDDDGELVTLEYQAETPRECAEIVSKIKYVMKYLLHANPT